MWPKMLNTMKKMRWTSRLRFLAWLAMLCLDRLVAPAPILSYRRFRFHIWWANLGFRVLGSGSRVTMPARCERDFMPLETN
jgi:hypothetical protein